MTAKRTEAKNEALAAMRDTGISTDRIVYVGKGTGETGTYVPESAELLRNFWNFCGLAEDVVVFSGGGNAFFEKGKSVLESLGFGKHITYESAIHEFLSANDNGIHGPSKREWRTLMRDHSNDVASSSLLLQCLDRNLEMSHGYIARNLQLGSKEIDEAEVDSLIGKNTDSVRRRALFEYKVWMCIDAREIIPDTLEELSTTLDGQYWN